MQQIRRGLRGQGVVLMGKNTMVRKKLRQMGEENHALQKLLPTVRGNIGFVFTKGDLKDVRKRIVENRVQAPAKAGAMAPLDVYVPGGNTGMEPGKTSFFQALGIPTKISRGTIEIVNDVHLIKAGSKVGASEATLLNMLNISPFTYGLSIVSVYDNGTVFHPDVLDIDEDTLVAHFMSGVKNMAALSLALNHPTIASVPHLLVNGFKDVCSLSLATDISIPATEKVCFHRKKERAKDDFLFIVRVLR
jgi:large subunit ribosomal protein LP0